MRCIYYNVVRDDDGDIINDATITVYLAGSPTLASIYTSLTGTTATNSVTSNSKGEFTFYINRFDYCSDQKFKYTVAKTGISTKTYDYIDIDRIVTGSYTISTGTSVDVDLYVPEGVLYSVASGTTLEIDADFNAGLYQVFSGSGAITGLTKAYPEWFGAVRDGSTDNTTAIQAALDSLTSGGILYFSAGTYSFTNLTITVAGTILEGDGWGSVLKSSLAATGNTATAILIQADNVTVKGFKLTYATLATALAATGGWVVQNNGIGVGVDPTVADDYYSNVTIDNVYILGGKTHGICIGRTINSVVKNCRVESVWGTGIWPIHAKDLRITNNYITETEDAGIDACSNGSDPASTGLAPWISDNIIIQGNTLYRTMAGIGCHGPTGCIIQGNTIDTTYSYGILSSFDAAGGQNISINTTIADNIVLRPWQKYGVGETFTNDVSTNDSGVHAAIEAWVDGALNITGNTVYDTSGLTSSYRGIWAGPGGVYAGLPDGTLTKTHINITGNSLLIDAQVGIGIGPYADVNGATAAEYYVDSFTVTGNNIKISDGNGSMAIHLNGAKNGVISGNRFDCGGYGLSDPLTGRFVVSNYSENVLITGNLVENVTGTPYSENVTTKLLLKGNFGVYDYPTPGWTDKVDTAPTLTIAEILKGIIYGTPTEGRAYTLPTGTLADASGYFALYGTFDWSIINLGAQNITLTADTGHTIVGNAVVSGATSAGWRTQKTAPDTFITYRIH